MPLTGKPPAWASKLEKLLSDALEGALFKRNGGTTEGSMEAPDFSRIAANVNLGEGVRIIGFVNLYGCEIGDETFIGPFVEIQSEVSVGKRCKIQSHSFLCSGVTIEDNVFVGHGVMFTNDRLPKSTDAEGNLLGAGDWTLEPTIVRRGASIGSGAVILPGLTIGEKALIGAGAVVTKSVGAGEVVAGVPARTLVRTTT